MHSSPVSALPLFLALAILPSASAAPKPIRVLYLDATGAEQSKLGALHTAMRENGRDAIFFDYFPSIDSIPQEAADLYDVALLSRTVSTPGALEKLSKSSRIVPIKGDESPDALRAAVLAAVTPQSRKDWEAFIAQREPELRKKSEYVANYEKRPEPVTFQKPFNAKGAAERTQVPADMRLVLFAESPDIGKPIAMAWDARGRCWVATTSDYPHAIHPDSVGNDKIVICEDSDGDGKADKFTVFADKLNLPTGLCFVNGGIMVAQPPHFLFLKDTDGDDKADIRQTIFGGMWGVADTHAQASSLHYGYDNWLYGAVGYSGFKGTVANQPVDFRMGTYRFTADGSKLEFLHQFSNNTWAHSSNDAGDQFGGTANGAPLFYGGMPAKLLPNGVRGMTAKRINVIPEAHPITTNFRQVDVFHGYTAACGSSFVYSANLPKRLQGKALVCEPTMKLVAALDVRPSGAGYQAFDSMNVFASTDEWTSPVFAEVGPDGAIWIADFQNYIIQHNPTPSPEKGGFKGTTGVGGAHENPLRDHSRGRIYRVVWNQPKPSKITPLENAKDSDLLSALNHDVQYWRLTAQRLLVEGKKSHLAPDLRKIVTTESSQISAIHALWSLHGLAQLDEPTLRAALQSKEPKLRRNAIRALGNDAPSQALLLSLPLLNDPDLITRQAAWVKLADFPTSPEIHTSVKKLLADPLAKTDDWLKETARALTKLHKVETYRSGPNLLANPSFESKAADGFPDGWKLAPNSNSNAKWELTSGAGNLRSGTSALRVSSNSGGDSKLLAEVTLKPKTRYRLAGWVRGKHLAGDISLGELTYKVKTDAIKRDSASWSELETFFDTQDKTNATVSLVFNAKGEGYFDDIQLTEIFPLNDDKPLVGDVARGEQLFQKHPTAACILCHALRGSGSNVGPALDGIASRKDAAYIKQSLLEPNAVLAQGYENLQVSPMPPMGILLTPQELEDIQAFLQTLK